MLRRQVGVELVASEGKNLAPSPTSTWNAAQLPELFNRSRGSFSEQLSPRGDEAETFNFLFQRRPVATPPKQNPQHGVP
jgi:hypothetical protein